MADRPKLLFQGYRGKIVAEVKQRMQALGFYRGPIDDHYDSRIAGAVVKLQQQEKIKPVNGGFFDACWDALERLEAKRSKEPGPAMPDPPKPDPAPGAQQQEPEPEPRKSTPPPAPNQEPAPKNKPAPPKQQKPPPAPLAPGAKGGGVVELQRKLMKCGYNAGGADGDYGPATTQAVRAFQAGHGLAVTGRADRATLDALELASQSVSPPSEPARVHPPNTAAFSKPGWNQGLFRHGDKAELFANARGLEGKDVIFIVEVNHGDGKWAHFADVPGKVSDGLASAQLDVKNEASQTLLMRFKVQLASQKHR